MATKQSEQARFRQAGTLFVSDQGMNYEQSMRLLADNGLRPLTYQEALSRAPELIKSLKGKWFFLDGKGITENGIHAFDAHGELIKPIGNETYDQKVRAWSGNPLFSFIVLDAVLSYGRFAVGSGLKPDLKATVVVGIKDATKSLEEGRAALTRLRRGS